MMKAYSKTLIALMTVGMAWVSSAHGKIPLVWIKWEQAPLFITKGSPAEIQASIYQRIIDLLHAQPEMSSFEQEEIWVNHTRFNRVAANDENCYVGWQTFPKSRIASRPVTITRPWVLWTTRANTAQLGATDTPVSLETLLANGTLTIGGIRNFSYSPEVLRVIKKYASSPNLYLHPLSMIEVNPRLLDSGRVDAFLGNPGQMQYLKNQESTNQQYVSYNLQEEPFFTSMVVSCSNTPKGRQVIGIVNDILNDRADTFGQTVLGYHDAWHGEVTALFRELFNWHVIKQQPHPLIRGR